jgi:hypothetical protein
MKIRCLSGSRSSLTSRKLLIILSAILILTSVLPLASARYGYTLCVEVNDGYNSTTWCRSFSAMDALTLQSESKAAGNGNFSKYSRVTGTSGISFLETTSGSQGKLAESNKLKVLSLEGEITINGVVYNQSNPITDSTLPPIKSEERVHIETNETAPFLISNQGEILFRGKAINNRNYYANGDYKIETAYSGKFLNKKVAYGSVFRNSLSDVDMTATSIRAFEGENRSMALGLSSTSEGVSEFKIISGSNNALMEEIHAGSFTISRKILMGNSFQFNKTNNEEDDWMPCCLSASELIDPETYPTIREIFDINKFQS